MKRHCVRLQLRFEAPKDGKLEMLSRWATLSGIHCYNCHIASFVLVVSFHQLLIFGVVDGVHVEYLRIVLYHNQRQT